MTVAAGPSAVAVRHVEHCMGTAFSLRIAAPGVERADLLAVLAWLHDMDAVFSTYRPDSQISALAAGRLRAADARPEVRHMLAECERFRVSTDGWFDARAEGRLDPSGYVKGWAIRTTSQLLTAAGSTNHCVNGGGDVMCVGQPEPHRRWRVGVADPRRPDTFARVITAAGPLAVATSGLAERGAHIVDPHTGRPATELVSVTVASPDMVEADVFATAAVAMGTDRALAWLGERPGVVAILITADGRVIDVEPS